MREVELYADRGSVGECDVGRGTEALLRWGSRAKEEQSQGLALRAETKPFRSRACLDFRIVCLVEPK